jgi:hypothetical protein
MFSDPIATISQLKDLLRIRISKENNNVIKFID